MKSPPIDQAQTSCATIGKRQHHVARPQQQRQRRRHTKRDASAQSCDVPEPVAVAQQGAVVLDGPGVGQPRAVVALARDAAGAPSGTTNSAAPRSPPVATGSCDAHAAVSRRSTTEHRQPRSRTRRCRSNASSRVSPASREHRGQLDAPAQPRQHRRQRQASAKLVSSPLLAPDHELGQRDQQGRGQQVDELARRRLGSRRGRSWPAEAAAQLRADQRDQHEADPASARRQHRRQPEPARKPSASPSPSTSTHSKLV